MPSPVGIVQCATVMTLLGSSFALTRALLDYPVLTGQALRFAAAAALLAVIVSWWSGRAARRPVPGPRDHDRGRVRPTGPELLRLCLLGVTGMAAFNLCVLETLRHTDPAVVGTAVGAAPVALALLGPVTRGRRPAFRLVAAAAVVVAGAALVHGAGGAGPVGLAWAVGAFGNEVAFSLLAAPLLPRLGPLRVSGYACGFAAPVLAGAAVVAGERWRVPTVAEAATLAFLVLALTVVAVPLWYAGIRRLTVERAGLFIGLLPVVTLLATAVLDLTVPPAVQVAGVLLVATGLVAGLAGSGRSGGTKVRSSSPPGGTRRVVTGSRPLRR